MSAAARRFRLALAQLKVTADKAANVEHAVAAIREAGRQGANLIVLPECFNCPYGTSFFPEYAEAIPGPSTDALSKAASETKMYVVGGSIPEADGDLVYNTSTVFDPEGNMIAKHRKVHLFDIDVPGGITFKESETLTPGAALTTFDTIYGKIGLGICYDVRFPEMSQLYQEAGCDMICFPGAFNMTTGPAHWELLLRSRALDNQLYVAAVSPARDEDASYVAWGHSMAVDPWGTPIVKAASGADLLFTEIDFAKCESVRQSIPIRAQKRSDLYLLTEVATEVIW